MASPDPAIPPVLRAALPRSRGQAIALALRLVAYGALWWILTGGEGGWLWGLPAVLAAALFNPFPGPDAAGWRLRGLASFAPVFVWLSLRSATGVARRALNPRRPLTPTLIAYPWRLTEARGQVFFANLVNLMPGTLCVGFASQGMTLHILGEPGRTLAALQRLERVVARLFEPQETPHD